VVIEARGVTAGYGRESVVVRNLDLTVHAG
jgi:hypothetical protein